MSETGDEPPAPAASPEAANDRCPECGAEMAPGAVLCVACGYDRQAGRRLETVREPLIDEALTRAPQRLEPEYTEPDLSLAAPLRKKELEKNLDLETRVFWLEERVRDLERRVSGTNLTSREFAARMFAVFGHWLLAFLAIAFSLGALIALILVLTNRW